MQPNLYGEGLTSDDMQRKGAAGESVDKKEKKTAVKPITKRVASYWREIERYKRASGAWHEEAKQIESLYLDEDRGSGTSTRRFALLWANVETLKPAVYAKIPNIQCSRRFKDKDPVARTAAELIERATNTTFEIYDVDETFQMVRDDRLLPGRGQAWVRYEATIERYEGETETGDQPAEMEPPLAGLPGGDPLSAEPVEPEIRERLKDERVCVDYVHWADFGHNVAGTWGDVWLVWRCVYKTQDEIAARFGKKIAQRVSYNAKAPAMIADRADSSTDATAPDEYCRIYECWDKRARKTTWISEGMKNEAMDDGEPPVDFSAFFPCPRPCYATKTSRSLIPRPDYIYYRDQAKEINDLTDKIANMMDWLIVKGFVPSAPSRISDSIEEAIRDNSNSELFVQVESMAEWTERGGISKLIDWLPLDTIIQAIQAAISARMQLIQDVFQITGISDILRGQTDPSETLGAQELKAQTGSRRLRNTKDEVARFCRDVGRLAAEIIAEKFEPETLAAITGYRYKPQPSALPALPLNPAAAMGAGSLAPVMVGGTGDAMPPAAGAIVAQTRPGAAPAIPSPSAMPPAAPGLPMPAQALPAAPGGAEGAQDDSEGEMTFDDKVIELLRNDRLRTFRIDIETDSTAQADENAERQGRVEYITAVGGFLEKAMAAASQAPEIAPLVGEQLLFLQRGFRAGRSMEEETERVISALVKKTKQAANQPPQPSPEQIKAEADAKAKQQQMAEAAAKHQQEMERSALDAANAQAITDAKLAEIAAQAEAARELHIMRMAELEQEAEVARLKEVAAMNEAARRREQQEMGQAFSAAPQSQTAN